jgi:GTPase
LSGFGREDADEFARGARTLIVYPELPGRASLTVEARLEEATGLALAIGLNVVCQKHFRVRSPKASTLLGGGQVQEIVDLIKHNEIELLILDTSLTAIQQRVLEERTEVKTIDRTGLILEIFGERAATAEGRLQVELAHLDYQAGRLVRSWTHLERQRGGFGFLGGPGETQIEADRRMIRDRMAS